VSQADYVLSAPAIADLEEIYRRIARDDPEAALAVLTDLREAMLRLATMPGLGHTRDDLAGETCTSGPFTPTS
jgi:plasmid stabilization system protein ParE